MTVVFKGVRYVCAHGAEAEAIVFHDHLGRMGRSDGEKAGTGGMGRGAF